MKRFTLLVLTLYLAAGACAQNWIEKSKIVASDREIQDSFGHSVSISGNYAVVGAYLENNDTLGLDTMNDAGSAYLFEKDSNGYWNQIQKIISADRDTGDNFGSAVSICGDYLIVGAAQEDEDTSGGNTLYNSGAAYIFERQGSGPWNQVQKIVAADRDSNDYFGFSVSISGDYVIVGAFREDEDVSGGNYLNAAGSAYLFERDSSGTWSQVQKLVASGREALDYFSLSVCVNGNYAIVGASGQDKDALGGNFVSAAGAAYLFKRDTIGFWNLDQKIVSTDRSFEDQFGISVFINGNYTVIGAFAEDEDTSGGNTKSGAGSAYIFEKDSTGNWNQVQKIVASDRAAYDLFGRNVAIDGNHIIVG
ncbi:MAG: FG-GAP repeat protein, partial [Bacteroidetes bacterium]|nr:FG-GAP repeat protein [Bacteroidota bacterium]